MVPAARGLARVEFTPAQRLLTPTVMSLRSALVRVSWSLLMIGVLAHGPAGCADDPEYIGEPGVHIAGSVALGSAATTDASSKLVVSVGDLVVDLNGRIGTSTSVHPNTSVVLTPTSFPATFQLVAFGLPFSGQAVAVLDLDGDGTIDPQDLIGEASFSDAEFDADGRLGGITLVLDVAGP